MKPCICCGVVKPLTEFYVHHAMADGYLNKCKVCVRAYMKRRQVEKAEQIRAYEASRAHLPHRIEARRAYRTTAEGRAAQLRSQKRQRARAPEKAYARGAVAYALRKGSLVRRPCEVCGCASTEAHHDDYSKPLEVKWLCQEHHRQHHNNI